MEQLNVSLVYGVEVPRGTPAAAFAGNAAVEFVRPRGATYPVVYAPFSRGDLVAAGVVRRESINVTSLTNEHERMAAEWRRTIVEACASIGVIVNPADCGWMVVCDVR